MLGNIKYRGVLRIYSDPFSKRLFHGRNRQDLVLVRPGIMPGEFVLSPDSVYYCRIQLLFSFSSMTDTGVQPFDCALVSVLEPYEGQLASGNYCSYSIYIYITHLDSFIAQIGCETSGLVFCTSQILQSTVEITGSFNGWSQWKVSSAKFHWSLSATLEQFHMVWAQASRARMAIADRAPATDAGCGTSTRGLWAGPVTYRPGCRPRPAPGRRARAGRQARRGAGAGMAR